MILVGTHVVIICVMNWPPDVLSVTVCRTLGCSRRLYRWLRRCACDVRRRSILADEAAGQTSAPDPDGPAGDSNAPADQPAAPATSRPLELAPPRPPRPLRRTSLPRPAPTASPIRQPANSARRLANAPGGWRTGRGGWRTGRGGEPGAASGEPDPAAGEPDPASA